MIAMMAFGLKIAEPVPPLERRSVKNDNFQLLLAACRHTARAHPQLQHRQGETPDQSAGSIDQEMQEFLGAVFKDRADVAGPAVHTMQPLLMVFDLALLQICDLSHFAWANRDGRARLIWPVG